MTRILKPLPLLSLLLLLGSGLGGCTWWHETGGGMIKDYGHMNDYNPEAIPLTYCYRTRGTPECYREPQRGQESRLITEQKKRKSAKPEDGNGEPEIVFAPAAAAETPAPATQPATQPATREVLPIMSKDQIAPIDAPTPITK